MVPTVISNATVGIQKQIVVVQGHALLESFSNLSIGAQVQSSNVRIGGFKPPIPTPSKQTSAKGIGWRLRAIHRRRRAEAKDQGSGDKHNYNIFFKHFHPS